MVTRETPHFPGYSTMLAGFLSAQNPAQVDADGAV